MKKILTQIILLLLLINPSYSQISEGMRCDELVLKLGGIRNLNFLWLENKNNEENFYSLITFDNFDQNKPFYFCERHDFKYSNSNKTLDVLKDHKLKKIFSDPINAFSFVFSKVSQQSTRFIMTATNFRKYSMDREDMVLAIQKSIRQSFDESPDEIVQEEKVDNNEKLVVKKEEKKKPLKKLTKVDNTPPVISMDENIVVSDTTYFVEGSIKDNSSKLLYVKIDENIIQAKNGKFKIKRFSPIDESFSVIGIDQWGNKSKPKIINVTVNLKSNNEQKMVEKLKPKTVSSLRLKNKVAIIVGIEKYLNSPDAVYARADAKFFYESSRKTFGIDEKNIKLLIDEKANLTDLFVALEKWLPSKVKENETEIIIFFAGHGLASTNGEQLYILPYNSDPDLLNRTALSRQELFKIVLDLKPKGLTVFFDTCFSGISRDEETLLVSARPLLLIDDNENKIPKNVSIFSASKLNQFSSGYAEAKHGIFSYFLMKGLEGNADLNSDKKITNGELLTYLNDYVSLTASELGRQQNPSLTGDPDKVLVNFR